MAGRGRPTGRPTAPDHTAPGHAIAATAATAAPSTTTTATAAAAAAAVAAVAAAAGGMVEEGLVCSCESVLDD